MDLLKCLFVVVSIASAVGQLRGLAEEEESKFWFGNLRNNGRRRLKRSFSLTNGTVLSFKPTLTIDYPSESVDSALKISFPQLEYSIYTGYGQRSLGGQDIIGYMESIVQILGLDGKDCLLKTVCEIGNLPNRSKFGGIVGEIIDILFSAMMNDEDDRMKKYLDAETYGRQHGRCEEKFRSQSLMDMFGFDSI